ncbi:hypothetical protein K504DRAFT_91982 [Pleomassaria siparia CBS 279.74]|uniref:Uncharacterized protein n=1 Tax=Pleomassaria siparia CBS 279.74 TaxID=1314801 RepID=A0A6G1JY93_9PLEO|nr:hypothetical protein K504DRAFT_91982 [Pleomassaria siparia CBS 279.74]
MPGKGYTEKANEVLDTRRKNNARLDTTFAVPDELMGKEKTLERARYLIKVNDQHPEKLVCYECGSFYWRTPPKTTWKHHLPKRQNVSGEYRDYRKGFQMDVLQCHCSGMDTTYKNMYSVNSVLYRWGTFHEVMRGLRRGPRYGLPYLFNRTDSLGLWKRDVVALAVNDRLVLRDRMSFRMKIVDNWKSKFFGEVYLCPHMREYTTEEYFHKEMRVAAQALRELEDDKSPTYLHGFRTKTHRCTKCPTEVVIEVIPKSIFRGSLHWLQSNPPFILCLTKYVDFGAMMDPNELEWRSLTTWYKQPEEKWENLAFWVFEELNNVTREESFHIDLTHLEPISESYSASSSGAARSISTAMLRVSQQSAHPFIYVFNATRSCSTTTIYLPRLAQPTLMISRNHLFR